jgi:hypothetical protein
MSRAGGEAAADGEQKYIVLSHILIFSDFIRYE